MLIHKKNPAFPEAYFFQPIELCTQFTSAQMMHILNTRLKYFLHSREIFSSQQRKMLNIGEAGQVKEGEGRASEALRRATSRGNFQPALCLHAVRARP